MVILILLVESIYSVTIILSGARGKLNKMNVIIPYDSLDQLPENNPTFYCIVVNIRFWFFGVIFCK